MYYVTECPWLPEWSVWSPLIDGDMRLWEALLMQASPVLVHRGSETFYSRLLLHHQCHYSRPPCNVTLHLRSENQFWDSLKRDHFSVFTSFNSLQSLVCFWIHVLEETEKSDGDKGFFCFQVVWFLNYTGSIREKRVWWIGRGWL